jgi:hypothetical protein
MYMRKLLWIAGVAGLVMVTVFTLTAASTALAQTGTPPTQTPDTTQPPAAPGFMGRRGHDGMGFKGYGGQAGMDAIAKALGMTTDELSAQLWGGQTLADLAEKAGVKLTDLQKAVQDAELAALKDSIQQAVTDGKITQDQADWMLQGLDKGYWGGRGGMMGGFGCGGGHRGGMGGMFGGTRFAPSTSSSNNF